MGVERPSTSQRSGTSTTYEGHLKNHINPVFGLVPLISIRPTSVPKWVKDLHVKGLAPRTVETIYVISPASCAEPYGTA
ncbi:hypothetical protein AB0O34_09800 [Sphaerisporangium sp. NPDC088356]|uniref:hypothetical protein n=1 Tax=Sphaerisporangium sp. NPDC088356 TaxID=3154871 RepID=UPI0034325C5B